MSDLKFVAADFAKMPWPRDASAYADRVNARLRARLEAMLEESPFQADKMWRRIVALLKDPNRPEAQASDLELVAEDFPELEAVGDQVYAAQRANARLAEMLKAAPVVVRDNARLDEIVKDSPFQAGGITEW